MATKISALTAVSASAASDVLPVVQGGTTKKATLTQIFAGAPSATFYEAAGVTTCTMRVGGSQAGADLFRLVRADGSTNGSDCARFLLNGTQMMFLSPFIGTHDKTVYLESGKARIGAASLIGFSSANDASSAASDVGIKRNGIGVLEVNTGTAGAFAALKGTYMITTQVSAPADAALAASQVLLWFDDTNGLAKLKIKGKSADGTVVTGEVILT